MRFRRRPGPENGAWSRGDGKPPWVEELDACGRVDEKPNYDHDRSLAGQELKDALALSRAWFQWPATSNRPRTRSSMRLCKDRVTGETATIAPKGPQPG